MLEKFQGDQRLIALSSISFLNSSFCSLKCKKKMSLWIQFEYPHEFLTCISGYYSFVAGDEWRKVVKSLTFYTNRRRYGPYGEETGTYFTSTKDEGKIIGFHERASSFLYAIGVHIQPSLSDRVYREPKGCPPQYQFNFYQ